MKKERVKKILLIGLLLAIVFIINLDNIFAAINSDYYNSIKSSLEIDDTHTNQAAESSPLLDAIAILVYAVGSLLEKILGYIFKVMSGENIFPWADTILFNAIPLLDINIFNPDGASFVKILQDVVADVYWTVFTLASSFFGIAIMITAIKLVVSTIASDKATYKQAIVRWIMGFVMLWGIHFVISFALYLNEQLVIAAEDIASERLGNMMFNIEALTNKDEEDAQIANAFVNAMLADDHDWLGALITVVVTVVVTIVVVKFAGLLVAFGAISAKVVTIIKAVGVTTTIVRRGYCL